MATTVEFFDPPEVIDCSVTPIPGNSSPPMQVVAKLSKSSDHVHIHDSTGKFTGVYVGDVGQEKLVVIVGGGMPNRQRALFAAGSRISVRAYDPTPISRGSLLCQFEVSPA
jgi:hypothetical protein